MSNMYRRTTWLALVGCGLLLALLTMPGLVLAQAATDAVEVTAQPVTNGAVTVQRVLAAKAGWIVIHADQGGQPGPVLGQTAVKQGENSNVAVQLNKEVPVNAGQWAMLHIDAGAASTYDFPGPDQPVFVNNQVVQTKFTVTAPSPTSLPDTGGAGKPAVLLLGLAGICVLLGLGLRLSSVSRHKQN